MRRTISMSLRSVALVAFIASAPAVAQDSNTNLRVEKLEKEMRAVQRKVFGAGGVVEPDITPSTTPTPTGPGSAAPVADLTARIDALENQLARLTGTVEENSYKLRQLENKIAALGTASSQPAAQQDTDEVQAPRLKPSTPNTSAAAKPTDARLAKVKAVEIPSTGNAAEDAYTYGYRLWDAQLYPEAQAQLQKVVKTYPNYGRMSFARNLLGRAYYDDGQYESAVHTFYDNYKNLPDGARAPDSLMYLGMTFAKMKNKQASCTAFTELFKNYESSMNSSLKSQATSERSKAGCAA